MLRSTSCDSTGGQRVLIYWDAVSELVGWSELWWACTIHLCYMMCSLFCSNTISPKSYGDRDWRLGQAKGVAGSPQSSTCTLGNLSVMAVLLQIMDN